MGFIQQQDRVAGSNGSYLLAVSASALSGITRYSFIPQEDTIVISLSGSDQSIPQNDIDLLPVLGISGSTLKQNSLHCVPMNYVIQSVRLISGSIILY